jgi:hypothetical protein
MYNHPYKSFAKDFLIRAMDGKPLGRIVLAKDYVEGADIAVAVLKVPLSILATLSGQRVWVDGNEYEIPVLPELKISKSTLDTFANHFYLKFIRKGDML